MKKLLAGIMLFLCGAVFVPLAAFFTLLDMDSGLTQFQAPGSLDYSVQTPGRYYFWHAYQTQFQGTEHRHSQDLPNGTHIHIQTDQGDVLSLKTNRSMQVSTSSTARQSIGHIDIEQPTDLTVVVTMPDGTLPRVFAFGPSNIMGMMLGILGLIAVCIMLVVAGLVLTIWGIVTMVAGSSQRKNQPRVHPNMPA